MIVVQTKRTEKKNSRNYDDHRDNTMINEVPAHIDADDHLAVRAICQIFALLHMNIWPHLNLDYNHKSVMISMVVFVA